MEKIIKWSHEIFIKIFFPYRKFHKTQTKDFIYFEVLNQVLNIENNLRFNFFLFHLRNLISSSKENKLIKWRKFLFLAFMYEHYRNYFTGNLYILQLILFISHVAWRWHWPLRQKHILITSWTYNRLTRI